jgi:hypothetical protein
MIETRAAKWLPVALFAIYLLGLAKTASVFPPFSSDETISSVHGYNIWAGHGNRYSLYDDVFDRTIYTWRDATPGIFQYFYNTWVGAFVWFLGKAPWQIRLSSISLAGLALFLMARIGFILGGRTLWYGLPLLLACNPLFILSATLTRAEIVILTCGTTLIWLTLAWRRETPWKAMILGLLAGLCITIHQNTTLTFGGLSIFYLLLTRFQKAGVRIFMLFLGYGLGVTLALIPVDLNKFVWAEKISWYELYKPPILSFPWHPINWILSTSQEFFSGEPTYFFKTSLMSHWPTPFAISGTLLISLVIAALIGRNGGERSGAPRMARSAFAIASFALLLALSILIRKRETLYGVVMLPFVIPLAGLGLQRLIYRQAKHILCFLLIFQAVGSGLFICNALRYRRLYLSFPDFSAQVHKLVPPSAKVIGPNTLWHIWPTDQMRDIGALTMSRWFTGGRRDVALWLNEWRPDVLIMDAQWKRMLLGPGDPLTLLRRALPCHISPLGWIDTGPGSDGLYQVYLLRWRTTGQP